MSRASKFAIVVSHVEENHPLRGREIAIYQRAKTGKLVACDGDAHSNPFIDNCGVCAPRWVEVEECAPVDFATARAVGAIDLPDLTNEEIEQERADHGAVLLSVRKVRRRRPDEWVSAFMVLAYPSLRSVS